MCSARVSMRICEVTVVCTYRRAGPPGSMLTEVSAPGFDSYHILSEGKRVGTGYEMFLNEFPVCRHYAHSGSETA